MFELHLISVLTIPYFHGFCGDCKLFFSKARFFLPCFCGSFLSDLQFQNLKERFVEVLVSSFDSFRA